MSWRPKDRWNAKAEADLKRLNELIPHMAGQTFPSPQSPRTYYEAGASGILEETKKAICGKCGGRGIYAGSVVTCPCWIIKAIGGD